MSACECTRLCLGDGAPAIAMPNTNFYENDCYCINTITGLNSSDIAWKSKYIKPYASAYSSNLDVVTEEKFFLFGLSDLRKRGIYDKIHLSSNLGRAECIDACMSLGANASTFTDDKPPGAEGSCWCDFYSIILGTKSAWSVAQFPDKDQPKIWDTQGWETGTFT